MCRNIDIMTCACDTSEYAELLYNDNPLSEMSVYLLNVMPICGSLSLSHSRYVSLAVLFIRNGTVSLGWMCSSLYFCS